MCVLRRTLTPTGIATDVVVIKPTDVGTLQGDESITVTITELSAD